MSRDRRKKKQDFTVGALNFADGTWSSILPWRIRRVHRIVVFLVVVLHHGFSVRCLTSTTWTWTCCRSARMLIDQHLYTITWLIRIVVSRMNDSSRSKFHWCQRPFFVLVRRARAGNGHCHRSDDVQFVIMLSFEFTHLNFLSLQFIQLKREKKWERSLFDTVVVHWHIVARVHWS